LANAQGHAFFIGIGGAGMSGIANILLEQGYKVSGSDLQVNDATKKLQAAGARVHTGHATGNITADVSLVVVSTAISQNNVEIQEARARNIEIAHRGDVLARLMATKKGIAIAGSHGKTTTTAMAALVLEKNNMDPTVIIGGNFRDIGGNAKGGQGEYLVAEADESDGSFLKLDPYIAVVTNVEDDHLDHYGSREKIKEAFSEFVAKIPDDGLVVLCMDDPNVREMAQSLDKRIETYGIDHQARIMARNIYNKGMTTYADIYFTGEKLGQLELNVPGRHNINNAMAAVAVGLSVGLEFAGIAAALKDFKGVGRRFQLLGQQNGITVVDDYAHHPTEVAATLQAARQTEADRVIAVFQPHRYSRTKFFFKEFGASFADADLVIINEIYSAGEEPIEGVTADLIVRAAREQTTKPVLYYRTMEEIVDYLMQEARSGDLIMTLGAGNIRQAGLELAEKLKAR
jgi:UDP-N-acetylmuramate--alanine ligase